jgi:hypothetical protein
VNRKVNEGVNRVFHVPLTTTDGLVDDHSIIREGLSMVIQSQPDLLVIRQNVE